MSPPFFLILSQMNPAQILPFYCLNNVTYLLEERTTEPKKQPLLDNGCVTPNNGVTFGNAIFCAVRAEVIYRGPSVITGYTEDPCGGGVEYLHRDPASRRRRRKGKSQIWENKIWSPVPRDSDPKKTALGRISSIHKWQTRPLVREGAPQNKTVTVRE
jgi:hypothetical protein